MPPADSDLREKKAVSRDSECSDMTACFPTRPPRSNEAQSCKKVIPNVQVLRAARRGLNDFFDARGPSETGRTGHFHRLEPRSRLRAFTLSRTRNCPSETSSPDKERALVLALSFRISKLSGDVLDPTRAEPFGLVASLPARPSNSSCQLGVARCSSRPCSSRENEYLLGENCFRPVGLGDSSALVDPAPRGDATDGGSNEKPPR